jgi:glyoxylase-like metal-dependent hydrolase (beta-lactamase superfamily II)
VKKVINTHFHWDHWQGNQVYAQGNPGLEIISSDRCRERLVDPNAMNGGTAFIEKQIAAMPGEIARLKDAIHKAPDAATRSGIEGSLAQAEAYLAELKTMTPPVPTRTVSQTVKLQEGGRDRPTARSRERRTPPRAATGTAPTRAPRHSAAAGGRRQ